MEPEGVAYAEAIRALDQQRTELEHVRSRAGTLLAAATVVTSLFVGLTVEDKEGFRCVQGVAVALFCVAAASSLLVQWPWMAWKWIPPAEELIRDYVDGENRVEGTAMQRDLAVHLGRNLAENQVRLDRLYYLLMAGIAGLTFEVVFWLLSI